MKIQLLLASLLIGHFTFAQKTYQYLTAPKDATTDTYFNESIEDPYQWMENPDDPRLEEWLKAQADLTKKLSNRQTRKLELRRQIASMFSDTRREATKAYTKREDKIKSKYIFESKWNNDSKSPDLLYKTRGGSNYKFLIKAKDFRKKKTDHVIVKSKVVNEDEDIMVVTISLNGSDWETGYLFDFKTDKFLPDTLQNIRMSSRIAWHGKDLYYDAYDPPQANRELLDKASGQKLYKLSIGNIDNEPQLLYQNPDTSGTNLISFYINNDKLILNHFLVSKGKYYNSISIADLNNESFFPKNFLTYPNADNISIDVKHIENDQIFLSTNWNAPNGKVLIANINQPNKLTEFIPEYDITLKSVNKLGQNKIAAVYLHEGQNIAMIYNFKGELLKKIDFPKGKKLNYFYEYEDDTKNTVFSISSFYHPQLWYQISLEDLSFKPVEALSVPYNPDKLETRYVTFTSKDGTEVPMYITCQKDTKLNGKNPVLMYGYGGYGITVEPFFEESNGIFLLHGGILAIPNIRGGGANGTQWAMDGRRLKKQNAIDDFIYAAEFLINEGYTTSEKLAINGGSHGGMLVGAAITQRPELFKAAIAEAGPYDMLRKENFTSASVSINLNEYGTTKIYDDYINLKSYSPLHHIKPNIKYPNLLLITGDHDNRVPPLHSFKFLAEIQEQGDPTSLYHLYITSGSGHGGALTNEDWVDMELFKYYFIFDELEIDFY